MTGLRKILLGSVAAALAMTALGVPVAAADTTGTLVIVQGHPGIKVDICIGAKEQRSGKAYGSVYEKDVIGTGARLLRFYKYNPNKKCGGTLIAKKTLHITPGWDQTVVLTKKSPKIVMFDNTTGGFQGEIPPRGALLGYSPVGIRHAAEFPANHFFSWWTIGGSDVPWTLAANPVATKGQKSNTSIGANQYLRWWVTKPEQSDVVAARTSYMKASRRHEYVVIGTGPANARIVLIRRGVSEPSP